MGLNLKKETVEEAARGRWHGILTQLGVDPIFLQKKQGPCPVCGGKTRFRFDDYQQNGNFFCNKCGSGTGLTLVMRVNDWKFLKALEEVWAIVDTTARRPPPAVSDPAKVRAALKRMMKGCDKGRSKVEEYLSGRGLSVFPGVLKFHPKVAYYDGDNLLGYHPAMLGVVWGDDDSAQSIHRTYLADVAQKKKLMSAVRRGGCLGGAIRLFEPAVVMGVAEGVETAIACHELAKSKGHELPVWATISAIGMENWKPPKIAQKIVICADKDDSYAGEKAAYALAHRLVTRNHLEVEVRVPRHGDWLDMMNERNEEKSN